MRVPFADGSVHRLPGEIPDEPALMLADVLPTSYEVGVVTGGVLAGDTAVVIGAGPIGLGAVMSARLVGALHVVVRVHGVRGAECRRRGAPARHRVDDDDDVQRPDQTR